MLSEQDVIYRVHCACVQSQVVARIYLYIPLLRAGSGHETTCKSNVMCKGVWVISEDDSVITQAVEGVNPCPVPKSYIQSTLEMTSGGIKVLKSPHQVIIYLQNNAIPVFMYLIIAL